MPIDVFWDDDAKTILRANFSGSWTWSELHTAVELGWDMAAAVDDAVIKLNDWRESAPLPPGNVLEHFATVNNNIPHFRAVISVGASPIVAAIIPIAKQISGNQNRFVVHTIEEAYEIIQQIKVQDASQH
jgi:hypothetical protein